MASGRAVTPQGHGTTRIQVQTIDVDLSSPPEYPIGLKLLLNSRLHQRILPVPTTSPLHWDNVNPIDAKLSDHIEVRIYEHHKFGYRKIRVATVMLLANQVDGISTEITGGLSCIQATERTRGVDLLFDPYAPPVVDNTGLVPCSVKLTFPSPEEFSSIPHSVNKLAVTAACDKPTMLDSMGRIRDVIGAILKIGQQVSELNPIAKATFGLCNLAWQTLEKQDKYDKLVVDLVLGMSDLLPLVDAVKGQAKIKQLQATIIEILELVEDASRFVIDYESNGAAVRTIRAFVSSTAQEQVDEFLKQFKRLKEAFEIGMTAQVVAGVETLLKDTDQEILMKIIAPDAGYNPSAGCLRGTRATVQTEIQDWINSDNGPRSIYWISGLAGCGKSTVAHSICQYLDNDSRLAGSFFCKRDNEQLNKPENVVSTIAANLGFQCQPYGAQLVAALRKDPRIANKALLTRFEQMIVQPIQSMSSDTLPQTTFIVIDALDECGTTETRAELVKQLTNLVKLVPWVKIIATSRRDHGLELYLKGNMVLRRDLSSDYRTSVMDDIEQLIRHRLKELMDDDEMLGSKPWLDDGTVTRLTAQANELFIWAQTACNIICKSTNPDKKIDEMLSGGVSQDAMVQLHLLYGRILHEALGEVTGGVDVVRSCIAAVVSTRVPLIDTDMARLLEGRVELVELRRVIRRLSSVLYRDQYGAIRVIHQSFGDYMRDEQCPLDYRTHKDRQNASFAVSCLQIMIKGLKFNMCQLEDSGLFNHEVADLSTRIDKNIPTYLQYSCIYWADHLLATGAYTNAFGEHQSALGLLLLLLEGPQVLYWIEVMSLLCKLHECETALIELRSWVLHASSKLQRRVEEFQQLVTDFYLPISQSTPHLYVSALALKCVDWDSPQSLQNEFPNRVQVVRGTHLAKLTNRWTRPILTRESVSAVAYSPDGRLLVASCNLEVLVFDAFTGATLRNILHNNHVCCVAVSPDSKRIITGSEDHGVRVWDIESGSLAFNPLLGHTGVVTSVAFSSTGRLAISGSGDKTIRIWDVQANVGLVRVLHHPCPVSSVAFSPDGSQILSGSDRIIRLWDAHKSGNRAPRLVHGIGRDTAVIAVAFSPNGCHIASLSMYVGIRIWNTPFSAPPQVLRPHEVAASLAFSPDSRHVVCGTYNGVMKVYDIQSGMLTSDPILGHNMPVTCLAFSPDGLRIVSGSDDRTVRFWDARPHPTNTNPLQAHSCSVDTIDCSPNGEYIASGSKDKTVRVRDAHTGVLVLEPITVHSGGVTSVAFSPDSRRIASGSWDRMVWVWDVQTGAAVLGPLCHPSSVEAVTFSSDGRLIASSNSTSVHLWDAESGAALPGLHGWDPESQVLGVSSPDDQGILSVVLGRTDAVTFTVWNARTGILLRSIQLKVFDRSCVALSSNGRFFAVSGFSKSIQVWDADAITDTGAPTHVLRPPRSLLDSTRTITLSHDGLRVAVCYGHQLKAFDVHSGNALAVRAAYWRSPPTAIVFSRDGQRILCGKIDGSIDVWDASGMGIGTRWHNAKLPPGVHEWRTLGDWWSEDPETDWRRDKDGRLLLWVPYIYHNFTIEGRSSRLLTVSTNAQDHVVSFDFTKFKYGKDWTSIHVSDPPNHEPQAS